MSEYKSIFDLDLKSGPMIFPGMDEPKMGDIRLRATANCGICANWDDAIYPTKAAAARFIKTLGWKLTVKHGWVCSDCAAKL